MRKKIVAQPSLFDQAIRTLLALFKPDKTLQRMDHVLEQNPEILDTVHRDLTQGLKATGRKGLSAERVLRCAILKKYKRCSYRELRGRIQDGVSMRWFTRFYSDP